VVGRKVAAGKIQLPAVRLLDLDLDAFLRLACVADQLLVQLLVGEGLGLEMKLAGRQVLEGIGLLVADAGFLAGLDLGDQPEIGGDS
jgi:hypothetical protein